MQKNITVYDAHKKSISNMKEKKNNKMFNERLKNLSQKSERFNQAAEG